VRLLLCQVRMKSRKVVSFLIFGTAYGGWAGRDHVIRYYRIAWERRSVSKASPIGETACNGNESWAMRDVLYVCQSSSVIVASNHANTLCWSIVIPYDASVQAPMRARVLVNRYVQELR